ncbi:biotin/lipoyl-containing protein [Luteococcus peritonei]|uniref:Biotin/lipoyl-containing protein n=1 Tax=Luteococcus peritonei TaxID=88874 RepID=A0ABW4RU33_9ACTN
MRRYTVSINGSDHELDVEEVTANSFRVQIAGRTVDVRLRDHQDLAQAMITPSVEVGQAPVQHVAAAPAAPAARPAVPAQGAPSGPPPRPAASAGGGAAGALTAPMPGVVLSIAASPGNAVKRGDPLLVLEAMKMKNELRAPKDGVVSEINCEVGQQVVFGDVLVRFEG